jgi:hypothetical protein
MVELLKVQAHIEHNEIKWTLEDLINRFEERMSSWEIEVMMTFIKVHAEIAENLKNDIRSTGVNQMWIQFDT